MLAWPIFLEVFLQTLLGSVDTIMVSRLSDDAVAIVGLSNQLFNTLITLFTTLAGGAGILIAQRFGSQRYGEARSFAIMGLSSTVILGILSSIVLYLFPYPIARAINVSDELLPAAGQFIGNVGAGLFLVAFISALGSGIRNTGNTKGPMYIGIGVNILHIVFNYLFLFGAFGFPEMGLNGIALSNIIARGVGVVLLFYIFCRSFDIRIKIKDLLYYNRAMFREIVKISWPLGLNSSAWVFSQLAMYSFMAMLGAKELAARTYLNTLESFCFTLGYAVALAGQIMAAQLFGAMQLEKTYKSAYRTLFSGQVIVAANVLLLFAIGRPLLGLFTSDAEIIGIGISLLALNLLLQPAKMLNMAMGNALNAVGDTRFTMTISIISMTLVGIGGSYLLGITAGWGLKGIYVSMISDEAIRGVLVLIRWRKQKLLRKAAQEHGGAVADYPYRPEQVACAT